MTLSLSLFFSVLLFIVGMRLSAFFSGSETGFYRVSTLQVTLQKQSGDAVASRLYYFVTHPERFVATTLVGNNVANYLTTLAIGLIVASVWDKSTGAAEILATLMLTPVIFVFGELIPKILYYRSPMSLLRSGSVTFSLCYYLFLPLSYPLIRVSRWISRFGASDKRPIEVVFGRNRLYGVLEAGEREGILTELQRNLAENVMQVASLPVELSMTPASTVQGVGEDATMEEVLAWASAAESAYVMLHKPNAANDWSGYVRVADMLASGSAPRHVMRRMPAFEAGTPRLEVLTTLSRVGCRFGVVMDADRCIGVIKRQTLVSQLFRVIRPASPKLDDLLSAGI
jgi:putative hemolysin